MAATVKPAERATNKASGQAVRGRTRESQIARQRDPQANRERGAISEGRHVCRRLCRRLLTEERSKSCAQTPSLLDRRRSEGCRLSALALQHTRADDRIAQIAQSAGSRSAAIALPLGRLRPLLCFLSSSRRVVLWLLLLCARLAFDRSSDLDDSHLLHDSRLHDSGGARNRHDVASAGHDSRHRTSCRQGHTRASADENPAQPSSVPCACVCAAPDLRCGCVVVRIARRGELFDAS